jgi:hypothetical protein
MKLSSRRCLVCVQATARRLCNWTLFIWNEVEVPAVMTLQFHGPSNLWADLFHLTLHRLATIFPDAVESVQNFYSCSLIPCFLNISATNRNFLWDVAKRSVPPPLFNRPATIAVCRLAGQTRRPKQNKTQLGLLIGLEAINVSTENYSLAEILIIWRTCNLMTEIDRTR